MSVTEIPGDLPVQPSRAVLMRRTAPRRPPLPSSEQPAWRDGVRAVLPAFARQVLLRPMRIGSLALLGAMTAIVLVGAEGWWMVLGITLFQAAASTLTVKWVDLPARAHQPAEHQPAEHQRVVSFVPDRIPRQRQPRPDE